MRLTPRSGDRRTVVRGHMVTKFCKGFTFASAVCLYCCVFYLNLLLYVVKDEPLGVDKVIWGVEGDGVQWSVINAASIHRPASRFWPHQPFDWRDKRLWGQEEMLVNLIMWIMGVSSIHLYLYSLCYNPNCLQVPGPGSGVETLLLMDRWVKREEMEGRPENRHASYMEIDELHWAIKARPEWFSGVRSQYTTMELAISVDGHREENPKVQISS